MLNPLILQDEICDPTAVLAEHPSTPEPVSVSTEWDPLREVIVGDIKGARFPDWHQSVQAVIPARYYDFFREKSGGLFPHERVTAAQRELDGLAEFLTRQGITVRRPECVSLEQPISTPYFNASGGMYHAMPRDSVLIVANVIIEAPMSWRNRYFETAAYKAIFKDYSERGAIWISAPKPKLGASSYRNLNELNNGLMIVSEEEPLFDAADFLRLGNELIGQVSHVTNWAGVRWLRRTLGPKRAVRIFEFSEPAPMHIDTTLMPLANGKLLINPNWVEKLPSIFRDWDVRPAPPPTLESGRPLFLSSAWLSMNVLVLDEQHVLVEEGDSELKAMLKDWRIEAIPLPFRNVQSFGGSFHCATLDIRRGATQVP